MEERLYWIWLSLALTPGSPTFSKLLNKFNSALEIYQADEDMLTKAVGSRCKEYLALCDKDLSKAERILKFCLDKNVGLLCYSDSMYPTRLKTIKNPPVLLYYRGTLPDIDREFCVAVVGTRRLSDYGRKNAFKISLDLARAGALIVSGMAVGVDGVAHAGALAVSRKTIAVIGSGIDVLYPKAHGKLAKSIVACGCVMTEFAPGTPPNGYNFPIRNRIVSGLSNVTLVVEGAEKSGAILTARHAREQDRVVYALPGNVGSRNSEACNLLLKSGARVCTAADDIIRDNELTSLGRLNPHELAKPFSVDMNEVLCAFGVSCVSIDDNIFRPARGKPSRQESVPRQASDAPKPTPDALSRFDKKIIALYQSIPLDGECLVESLVTDEMTLRDVMRGLLSLEMGGFIEQLPGERVKRKL